MRHDGPKCAIMLSMLISSPIWGIDKMEPMIITAQTEAHQAFFEKVKDVTGDVTGLTNQSPPCKCMRR